MWSGEGLSREVTLQFRDFVEGLIGRFGGKRLVLPQSAIATLLERNSNAWRSTLKSEKTGPRVLIATNVTGLQHASLLEPLLAIALSLRGVAVDLIACDAVLPACQFMEPASVPDAKDIISGAVRNKVCDYCVANGAAHFDPLGLQRFKFSDLVTTKDLRQIRGRLANLDREALLNFRSDTGDELGEHALAGALRYFAVGKLPATPEGVKISQALSRGCLADDDRLRAFTRQRAL